MTERVTVTVRPMTAGDFDGIIALTKAIYPGAPAWKAEQLESHMRVFPEGQLVAERQDTGDLVAMSASLIVLWDDYELTTSWRDFTDAGMFTNHDPSHGRTLYGAEIMVDTTLRGHGIGSAIYSARAALARDLGLLRIRAGARLRDYAPRAATMSSVEYVRAVLRGELSDRTLSFQLRRGFQVIGVVNNYLRHDPESLGNAAVIEWVNREAAGDSYQPPPWSMDDTAPHNG
ncbi:hypothetical protein BH09GEM1_BH09GEM1_39190 [soil metagenome]